MYKLAIVLFQVHQLYIFDKIAKQRIYESIDTARFSDMKLKEAYFNLRFKLGRIPKISDFADHGSIDY